MAITFFFSVCFQAETINGKMVLAWTLLIMEQQPATVECEKRFFNFLNGEVIMNRFIRCMLFVFVGLSVNKSVLPAFMSNEDAAVHAANLAAYDGAAGEHVAGFYVGPSGPVPGPDYRGWRCTHCQRAITVISSIAACRDCGVSVHRGCRHSHRLVAERAALGAGAGAMAAAAVDEISPELLAEITSIIDADPAQLLAPQRGAAGAIVVQGIKTLARLIEEGPTGGDEEMLSTYQMTVDPAVTALLNRSLRHAVEYLNYLMITVGQEVDLEDGTEAEQLAKSRRWHWMLTLVDETAKRIIAENRRAARADAATADACASLTETLTTSTRRAHRPAVMAGHDAAYLTASTRVAGCAICTAHLRPADRKVAKLECGHMFHAPCIRTWTDGVDGSAAHSTCPTCRGHISEIKKAEIRRLAALPEAARLAALEEDSAGE